MLLYLVIKKVTLSETANSTNWGDFSKLLDLPLSIYQSIKVTEFFEATEFYRLDMITKLSLADGHGYKFVSELGNSTAFTFYAVRDIALVKNVIETGEEYDNFVAKRDSLFSELGWVIHEARVAECNLEFDKEASQYINVPNTMDALTELYNSGTPLSTLLGQ